MHFIDRSDAGRKLALGLARYKPDKPVIMALVRGGLVVAAEIAAYLEAPLDIVLVRKIGVPFQEEVAMGAVVDGDRPTLIRNEDVIGHAGVSEAAFQAAAQRELAEIERRRAVYLGGRSRAEIKGRVVIIVDDGIATGATMRAALRSLRAQGAGKLVLAVPVAPSELLWAFRKEADDIICLEDRPDFTSVGSFYSHFPQVNDEEVIAILDRFSLQYVTAPLRNAEDALSKRD